MGEFYNLFFEKTFPSELYHGTSLEKLFDIVRDDKILLSYTGVDGADKEVNEDADFFLSMSYQKYGRYLNLGNEKVSGMVDHSGTVILVMDTNSLQSRGKLIDVDYWASRDYADNEKEVRYISNERDLTDVSKFVKEVHVYLNPTDWFQAKESVVKKIVKLVNSDLNVYLYNDSRAFRILLKAKSISIEDLKEMIFSIERTKKDPSKYRNPNRESFAQSDFLAILNILKGQEQESEMQERAARDFMYNLKLYVPKWDDSHPSSSGFITQVRNTIHNVRREKIPEIKEFSRITRKLGIRNTKDLLDYLHDKLILQDQT